MEIKWKNCFRIGISIFVLYLSIYYWAQAIGFVGTIIGAAYPLILGFVIAYIVNILMSMYERYYFPGKKDKMIIKSRRPVCMAAAFVTVIALVCIIIGLVLPELAECIKLLFAKLPGSIEKFLMWMEGLDIVTEEIPFNITAAEIEETFQQVLTVLTSGVGNVMGTVVGTISSVFSGIVTALLSFIFAIYLLSGKERLKHQFKCVIARYTRDSWYKKITYVFSVMNECFHRYIVGQCTEAVILGLLCTCGMLFLRLPYATMIGALIAFTALIPVAGAYIGAGVGAFMILTVSPFKALIFLGFIVILQQLEGNIIYPRVVGSSMGLPAIWVLAAVTIGGGIMGVLGMLLGVPLAATAYRLLREDVYKKNVVRCK